jgi:hypothetical protein
VLHVWAGCRSEFGMSILPDTGGYVDQAAWVLDAFSILNAVEAELAKDPD